MTRTADLSAAFHESIETYPVGTLIAIKGYGSPSREATHVVVSHSMHDGNGSTRMGGMLVIYPVNYKHGTPSLIPAADVDERWVPIAKPVGV